MQYGQDLSALTSKRSLMTAGVEEERCAPAQRLTPVILSEFGRRQDGGLMSDVLLGYLKEFYKEVWGQLGDVELGGEVLDPGGEAAG